MTFNTFARYFGLFTWAWAAFTFLLTFMGLLVYVIPVKGWTLEITIIQVLLFGGGVGFGWLYIRKLKTPKRLQSR